MPSIFPRNVYFPDGLKRKIGNTNSVNNKRLQAKKYMYYNRYENKNNYKQGKEHQEKN